MSTTPTTNALGIEYVPTSLIGGAATPQGTNGSFPSISRADGVTNLGTFFNASDDELTNACTAAQTAFWETNVLNPMSHDDFAAALLAIEVEAQSMMANVRRAGEHECAYAPGRSDLECLQRAMYQLRFHAEAAKRRRAVYPSISVAVDGSLNLRSMEVGRGVAFCAPSTNFPWGIGEGFGPDVVEPLRVGCSVVAKASEKHPLTAALMAVAVNKGLANAKHHPGRYSLVFSDQPGLGEKLFATGMIQVGGLTGSGAVGIPLSQAAFQHGVILHGELGSVNPVFALPGWFSTNGAKFATTWHGSLMLGTGQFCTGPGIVVIPTGEGSDDFETTLRPLIEKQPIGTLLHSGIDRGYDSGCATLSEVAGDPWMESKETAPHDRAKCRTRVYKMTAAEFLKAGKKAQIEVFAAVGLVVTVSSVAEMLEVAKLLGSQLTGCIYGTDAERGMPDAMRLRRMLTFVKAGRLGDMRMPTGVAVAPAQVHAGPWGASTHGETSIGLSNRFTRRVAFEDSPDSLLPLELQSVNPLGIRREVFVVDKTFGRTLFWDDTADPLPEILARLKG